MQSFFTRPRPRRGLARARRHPARRQMRLKALTQFTVAGWLFLIVATLGISRGGGDIALPVLAADQPSQLQVADISRSEAQLSFNRESESFDPQPGARLFTDDAPDTPDAPAPQQEAPAEPTQEPTPAPDEFDPADFSTALGVSQQYEPTPIFRMHEVKEGETVSEIAERYGVTTDDIVWNNSGVVDDADMLVVGAVLQIPGVSGIIHSVRLGETVSAIAVEYDATTEDIVAFEANGLQGDPDNIVEGSMILVPGGRVIPPEPEPAAEPAPQVPDWVAAQSPSSSGTEERPEGDSSAQEGAPAVQEPEPQPAAPPAAQPAAPSWHWPGPNGRITSRFGPRHPLGIDLSMVVGTPIVAAYPGQVVFVGGNACCSYGYHIIIKHENGLETRYAHLSKFEVSNGQWVEGGQLIGRSGNTGYSTGPHLHFEIRSGGKPQDPMRYLP